VVPTTLQTAGATSSVDSWNDLLERVKAQGASPG
jgi:hypothetical protein